MLTPAYLKAIHAFAIVACAAFASACSPASALYLGDSSAGSYAKVPSGWTAFPADEFLSWVHQAQAEPAPGQSVYAFSADGVLEKVLSGGDSLAGLLEVRPAPSPLSREQLLDMVFGNVSQLVEEGKATAASVTPAEPGEVSVRIEMEVAGVPATFLQRSMMMPDGRARVFVIGCSATCFQQNQLTAEQAFSSVVADSAA